MWLVSQYRIRHDPTLCFESFRPADRGGAPESRIPTLPGPSNPGGGGREHFVHRARRSPSVSVARKRRSVSVCTRNGTPDACAKSTRERRARSGISETRDPAFQAGCQRGGGTSALFCGALTGPPSLAWCLAPGCRPSSGSGSACRLCRPIRQEARASGRTSWEARVSPPRMYGAMYRAIASTTGTTTAFPNCL